MPPPIIRAICVFDVKMDEFFREPIHLSAYVEMNKKNFKKSDFYSRVPALLVENPADILPILTSETTFPPRMSLLTSQESTRAFG